MVPGLRGRGLGPGPRAPFPGPGARTLDNSGEFLRKWQGRDFQFLILGFVNHFAGCSGFLRRAARWRSEFRGEPRDWRRHAGICSRGQPRTAPASILINILMNIVMGILINLVMGILINLV